MNVGKAIYSILTADVGLAALVGTRIFPEMAPEDAVTPFLVYSILGTDPEDTKQATSDMDKSSLETFAVGEDYGVVMDVTEAARNALDRNGGNFGGVAIQSIQFVNADTTYNSVQRVYVGQQQYSVRQLRTGSSIDVVVNDPLGVVVTDGASVDQQVTTLTYPVGAISAAGTIGTVDLIYRAYTVDLLQQNISTEYLTGGASEIDLNSATPQLIPFKTEQVKLGTDIFDSSGTGIFRVNNAGTYRLDFLIVAKSDTHGVAPHFYVLKEAQIVPGEGTAFISAQHGVTHGAATFFICIPLLANERLSVYGYDESDRSGAITLNYGHFLVTRIN